MGGWLVGMGVGLAGSGCGWILGLDEFVDAPADAGAGGAAGGAAGCADRERDCVGDTPRECADGAWVAQAPCAGEAPVCAGGVCVACAEGARGCAESTPRRCEAGAWVEEAACADPYPGCRDGACVPASCQGGGPGAGINCGLDGQGDCCGSPMVPGGTFNRSNDPTYPATVSDFRLDTYEITVGRFRAFVEAGKGTQADPPLPGSGAHPAIPGSGWDEAWTAELETDTAALKVALKCGTKWFWTDSPGPNEDHPMHCMTWFEAFAFCAWDGGRLPTEAEWNYAAAGGSEQREYPWGSGIDSTKAAYGCFGDGSPDCTADDILPVGSKSPAGDAKWGHADMSGNIGEFVLDYLNSVYPTPCNDCAFIDSPVDVRAYRGGHAMSNEFFASTVAQSAANPHEHEMRRGVRCARLPGTGP